MLDILILIDSKGPLHDSAVMPEVPVPRWQINPTAEDPYASSSITCSFFIEEQRKSGVRGHPCEMYVVEPVRHGSSTYAAIVQNIDYSHPQLWQFIRMRMPMTGKCMSIDVVDK